jgi:hypothetical protein
MRGPISRILPLTRALARSSISRMHAVRISMRAPRLDEKRTGESPVPTQFISLPTRPGFSGCEIHYENIAPRPEKNSVISAHQPKTMAKAVPRFALLT